MAGCCCSYKAARQGLLVVTILTFIFSVVFVGVGGVSVSYGQAFANEINSYCASQCDVGTDIVGCNCKAVPPSSTLPSYFFISPSIGMIFVGIFLFATSIIGCRGAIREKNIILSIYILCLFVCIVLQFGFGVAAAAVSTGSAPEVQGPILGVIGRYYREFDWQSMDVFFPEGCYAGHQSSVEMDPETMLPTNVTYSFPLCDFDGKCRYNDPSANPDLRFAQDRCCDKAKVNCDTSQADCISGAQCVMSFLSKVGAPVAVVAFLALSVEILAFVFACIIRTGPGNRYAERNV